MERRTFNKACAMQALGFYPTVAPLPEGRKLVFPRDHGSHNEFRTEWWYVTGWLNESIGFQVTFFRSRTQHSADNPSRFAPTQLLLAHVALAIPENKQLIHDELAARAHPTLATVAEQDCNISLRQQEKTWAIKRNQDNSYRIRIQSNQCDLNLELNPKQAPWLQGDRGYSRKGPLPTQASFYYSRPQTATRGQIRYLQKQNPGSESKWTNPIAVNGISWFDHEWSSALLADGAVGWDWLGLNLLDGSALTIFRIRDAAGKTIHDYTAMRQISGEIIFFKPNFIAKEFWISPRTAVRYPIAWQIDMQPLNQTSIANTPVPGLSVFISPLLQDQELDGRRSTGTIYWEGAVEVLQNSPQRKLLGRGYLELTGYHQPVKL
jgi:predicted secreted hydrolase